MGGRNFLGAAACFPVSPLFDLAAAIVVVFLVAFVVTVGRQQINKIMINSCR